MKTLTHTIHTPTEQYGYVETVFEPAEIKPEVAAQDHFELVELAKPAPIDGLTAEEWNSVLDEYLTSGTVSDGIEYWERMSSSQRLVMNEIKKSIKRRQ